MPVSREWIVKETGYTEGSIVLLVVKSDSVEFCFQATLSSGVGLFHTTFQDLLVCLVLMKLLLKSWTFSLSEQKESRISFQMNTIGN